MHKHIIVVTGGLYRQKKNFIFGWEGGCLKKSFFRHRIIFRRKNYPVLELLQNNLRRLQSSVHSTPRTNKLIMHTHNHNLHAAAISKLWSNIYFFSACIWGSEWPLGPAHLFSKLRDLLHYFIRVHMHIGGSERPRDR